MSAGRTGVPVRPAGPPAWAGRAVLPGASGKIVGNHLHVQAARANPAAVAVSSASVAHEARFYVPWLAEESQAPDSALMTYTRPGGW
jgi:hypothetical protein